MTQFIVEKIDPTSLMTTPEQQGVSSKVQTSNGIFTIIDEDDFYLVTHPCAGAWKAVSSSTNSTLFGKLFNSQIIDIVSACFEEAFPNDNMHPIIAGKLTAKQVCDIKVDKQMCAHHSLDGEWYYIPYCDYSDYHGGSIERSNVEFFLKEFEEIDPNAYWHSELLGAMGYRAVVVRAEFAGELVSKIEELKNYPLVDEELHLKLEHESYVSARYDYLRGYDFARDCKLPREMIVKIVNRIDDDNAIDSVVDIRQFSHEESGENWYFRSFISSTTIEALIDLAMSRTKTLTCECDGWDVQFRKRNRQLTVWSRRWGRRDWRFEKRGIHLFT